MTDFQVRVFEKMWRSTVTGVLFVAVLVACGNENNSKPEFTYEPTSGGQFVTVEPLGNVFTHEPDSGLDSTSEPGN